MTGKHKDMGKAETEKALDSNGLCDHDKKITRATSMNSNKFTEFDMKK